METSVVGSTKETRKSVSTRTDKTQYSRNSDIISSCSRHPATERKQQEEANQTIRDLDERKIDDPLNLSNESMAQAMSVQALLHRGIGSAALSRADSQSLVSSGISTNAALQILTQGRARATLPNSFWTNANDVAYQNTVNTSGTNLVGSARGAPLATEIAHPSGVSPHVSDHLLSGADLMNYQRRLGAAVTSNTSLSTSHRNLPHAGHARASGLSPLLLDQMLSRASAMNYQRSLDQALAVIRENESARRVRQVQLSQNTHGILSDLCSSIMWGSINRQQSVLQSTDIRHRALTYNGSHPFSQAVETSCLAPSPGTRDFTHTAATAMGISHGFTGLPQPVAGRKVDRSAAANQGHDSAGILLATEDDEKNLSEYQTMVRKQLEFFEADEDDVSLTTQGRKKVVYIGQVGIRCIHCAHRPANLRSRGSVYFPSKLSSVYQAAQNMAVSHLMDACDEIDGKIRDQLWSLRLRKDTAAGGKAYWASSCAKVGVSETETGLRLTDTLRQS